MLRGTLESLTPQPGGTLASDNVASTWSLPFRQPTHGRVSSFVRWEAQLMSLVKQLFMCNLKHGNFFNKQTCIFFPSVRHRILCSRHIISLHLFCFYRLYLFLERGEGREKEGEKHQCVFASRVPPTGDLACNPGMCPDWESNWRPFGLQAGTQSTEPQQTGPHFIFN